MRVVLLVGFAGCGGDVVDPAETTPEDRFATFIDPTVEVAADVSCVPAGADWGSIDWLTQAIDPARVATFPLQGVVEDFQDEYAVRDATVGLWHDDVVSGQPDDQADGDGNGIVSLMSPSCQTVAYRVTSDGALATKTTYKAHQVFPYPDGAEISDVTFTSVSDTTYQLIPGILGVSVDPDKAIIAGTAFDCARDPALNPDDDSGKIEGVQVIVYDADGEIPDTLQVHYFTDSFPARDEIHTSPDGLWVASNVPPGELRVEMWGLVGGTPTLLGASILQSEADSINIANLFAGYGDGVKAPSSCVPQ